MAVKYRNNWTGKGRLLQKAAPALAFLILLGSFAPVQSQHEAFLVGKEANTIYQHLPEMENELYGHTYTTQSLAQRITRLEKTLFGAAQTGPQEYRWHRLEAKMRERSSAKTLADEGPMLSYLEDKLFQRTFESRSIHDRMEQLELHVFGHAFDDYPIAVRMKKLSYAMPIVAKEIRLAKDGIVIASTSKLSSRTSRTKEAEPELTVLDATSTGSRVLPNGVPVSMGDYFQGIYRQSNGQLLRWSGLPVRVYIKPASANDLGISHQAIQQWRSNFSVQQVSSMPQADVVVAWQDQHVSGILTRPMMQMDDRHAIRTVIYINMSAFQSESPVQKLHVLTHQLGHAFGLWGHSDDPADVMYPAYRAEMYDIPGKWAQRSAGLLTHIQPSGSPGSVQPSLRDFNTLLRVYNQAGTDLKTYDGN